MFFELATIAYLNDMIFGELPVKHPVEWMGDFVTGFERRFYKDRILPGAFLVISLLSLTLLISILLVFVVELMPDWLFLPLIAACASTGLAMNMLDESVSGLLTADNPKQALSLLVSRDTDSMSEREIYQAAIETWAENLSDGVIAPLFYLVLFGLPGIAVYKAINTLDSMVGYKTERYFYFGKTAAILDDMANLIPARITALLIVLLTHHKQQAWESVWRDANKLESPNAGYPIAAMAGGLGVELVGDATYHGQIKRKPTVGQSHHPVNQSTLEQALQMKIGINMVILSLLAMGIYFT